MVRIINGEIVSDDDPRVAGAQRRSSGGGGGGGFGGGGTAAQGRTGYGRVASLHDAPHASTASNGGVSRGSGRGAGAGGGGVAGPLDKLAEMIGVQGRFVTIPGALGVQENQVSLLHLMIAATVVLFGGWKAAAVMVFAYVITNQKGRAR